MSTNKVVALALLLGTFFLCCTNLHAQRRTGYSGYIDDKEKRRQEVEKTVKERLGTLTGEARWENFQGAEKGVVSKTNSQDMSEAISSFTSCQDRSNPHGFGQMLMEWEHHGTCYEYHQYPLIDILTNGSGMPNGLCLRIESKWPCFVYLIWADLVEYNYPAYKVDVSEQMYQSLYLDKQEVKTAIEHNLKTDEKMANDIKESIKAVVKKANDYSSTKSSGGDPAVDEIEKSLKSMQDYVAAHPDHVHIAPHSTKEEGRNVYEMANLFSAFFKWIPHQPQRHYFATDMPIGYAYSKILSKSKFFARQFAVFGQKYGERICVANNIRTGKTRPIPGFLTTGAKDQYEMCLDDVGEEFTLLDNRRLHITDASFATAEKAVRIWAKLGVFFRTVFGPGMGWLYPSAHTYDRKIDKWHVIRNQALKNETQSTCQVIDKLARVNTSFNDANTKEFGKGGENTFEVYPVFKGCWGFKGKDKGYWNGGIFEWRDSKIGNGKLRLY
jgi:hypothetical protein